MTFVDSPPIPQIFAIGFAPAPLLGAPPVVLIWAILVLAHDNNVVVSSRAVMCGEEQTCGNQSIAIDSDALFLRP